MRGASVGGDRFEVRARIGGGGGGVVFRALDRLREQEVALKLLHRRDQAESPSFRATFQALSRLAHPNLVQLYDLVEEQSRALLVMELIDGIDLLSYVRRAGQGYDELRVRAAFGQLGQGLCALHRERKVHRDVKPENVRVTSSGRVVLLDLDLALDLDTDRSERALGHTSRPVGTAAYMAPEQAASLRLSPACDWYSVGVVLYEALTGQRPYSGSDLEVLLEKQEVRPPPPSEHARDLPQDLARLCEELLTPDPRERPSGGDVLDRLGVDEDVLSARFRAASLLSARRTFVGREAELARVVEGLARSREASVVMRVTAHAGIGKSRLCEEALGRLTRADARVLALASSCPRYPEKPHAALHEPLSKLAQALREERSAVRVSASALRLLERAFPGVVVGLEAKLQGRTAAPPEPLEQRWRAIAALRAILCELAATRPLVLWLDDYHWADVDTQRLLGALVAAPDAPRMLLLLSEEPEPGAGVSSLPVADSTITLHKLSVDEARRLNEALLERAGQQLREAAAVSPDERSPLLIQERVRHALLFGKLLLDASFPELIAHRVRELSEPARLILELVCAAFDPLAQAVCERAAELDPATFTRQVATLTMSGLVRSAVMHADDALAPSHPLIAEFVDLELQGARRVAIHQRLTSALVAHDAARASGRLLRHQGESGDHTRAAESAELAAEQAYEALAFQRAAELFSVRASLKPPSPDEQGHRLLRRMAEALGNAGWTLSAATVYREAALYASAADALYMQQRSLEYLYRGAEVEEGERAMRELLAALGVGTLRSSDGALWALRRQRIRLRLTGLGFRELDARHIPESELRRLDALFSCAAQLSLVDELLAAELSARALGAARTLGEPQRMARALCLEAWNFVGKKRVDHERSERLLDSARALTERHAAPLLDGHLRLAQGMLGLADYRVRECSAHCRDAERVFRDSCADATWELSVAQVHQLLAISWMGHYRELGPKLAQYVREADERGDIWTHSALLNLEALGLALARGRPEEARARLHEASSRWGDRGTLHALALLRLLAESAIDLYLQEESAHEQLERRLAELEPLKRVPLARIALLELRGRTRLLSAVRRKDAALLRAVESDAGRLSAEHEPAASGFAHLLRASVYAWSGRTLVAVGQLERALSTLEPLGLGQWVLPAQLALGQLLGGARGQELVASAHGQLVQHGVEQVERFVAMMLPGFALQGEGAPSQ